MHVARLWSRLMSRLYYTEISIYECSFTSRRQRDPCASVYNSADRPTLPTIIRTILSVHVKDYGMHGDGCDHSRPCDTGV